MDLNVIELTKIKKLIFIPLLIFSLTLSAQFTKSGGTFLKTGSSFMSGPAVPLDYDDEIDTYILGLSTPLSSEYLTVLNTFVVALKDSLNISTLDEAFNVFRVSANETQEAALRNLVKRDHDATNIHSTAFTQYAGFVGDGANDYFTSGFNPGTDTTETGGYRNNSASFGFYTITSGNTAAEAIEGMMGGKVDDASRVQFHFDATFSTIYINAATSTPIDRAPTIGAGLYIATRSNHNTTYLYYNKTASDADNDESAGLPDIELYEGAINNNGSASYYFDRNLSLIFFGYHITTAMRDDIYDCFQVYLTAIAGL